MSARRRRNLDQWAYWRLRMARTTDGDPFPGGDAGAIRAWRERVVDRLPELLGPWPARVPLDLEVVDEEEHDGYRRQEVVFDSEDIMSVPAQLLVPAERRSPGPAVLAVHGHGLDKDRLCGIDAGDPLARRMIDDNHGDYARQLVQRGFVVLAPDLRGFGARADRSFPAADPDDLVADILDHHLRCDYQLVCGALAGVHPLMLNLWDLRCALDVLAGHPLVDPDRLGVAGWSYGGTLALFLAAVDPRVRAAVVSCFFSSWRAAHTMPWNMCGSQVLWGTLGHLEHLDLGAAVAPRPLCIESAEDDTLFPTAEAIEQVARLRTVYAALGADPSAVAHDVFPGDHGWHGTVSIDFLAAHLGL